MTIEVIPQIDLMQKFGQQRVGSGEQKDDLCDKFMGHVGCLRGDLHRLITLDGQDHSGKGFFKRVYHSCDRPECPLCYRRWAVRAAGDAEALLKKAAHGYTDDDGKKHSGLGAIEHIIDRVLNPSMSFPLKNLRLIH